MSGQSRPIWDFEDIGDYWKRADEKNIAPIIAVPTTAGTGSETGRASAIINKKTGVKKIIFHPKFLPSIVILDPVLTVDLSPRLTAATGMDALAHNLEAFCAPGFHPMADGIALEGMRLVKNSLLTAVKDGKNINARLEMLTAASMGSTAFQKGLGAIHSLSHPVNAQFNLHHGLSNAIFMPYVLTFNKKEISEKIVSICDYLNLEKKFDSFINWIIELRKDVKIPHKLSDVLEIDKVNLDKLSQMALEDPSTAGNPKKLTKEDMKIMYEHSLAGKVILMKNLNILVVEGNTEEENLKFQKLSNQPQSFNFRNNILKYYPDAVIDIVTPSTKNEASKFIPELNKYDGIIWGGSTLNIYEDKPEIRRQLEFAKKIFKFEKKVLAICWGLQLISTAAGGQVKKSTTGTQVGIAVDIELTDNGINHPVYKSKSQKFNTPAFNFDEVVVPPNNSIHLARNKTNKIQGLTFKAGLCDVWGLQYHPEIHYDYMVTLIKDRKEKLIRKKCFATNEEIDEHIKFIEKEKESLNDDFRLLEIKNWLDNLKL